MIIAEIPLTMAVKCMLSLVTMMWCFSLGAAQSEVRVELQHSFYEEQIEELDLPNQSQVKEALSERYTTTEMQQFRYGLMIGDYNRYFEVDETSGVLKMSSDLDRDAVCPQQETCIVYVSIAVQPPYFAIIKVAINILDKNDNYPTFTPTSYSLNLPENTPPGHSVPITSAEDLDSPKFGIQQYDLLQGGDIFELRVTGSIIDGSEEVRLVLKEEIDREIQASYQVVVMAKDGGLPPNTGTLSINIIVEDINDHYPQFELDIYELEVDEDLTSKSIITRVKAEDLDDGPNGEIIYGFSTKTSRAYGDIFAINNTTGEIILKSNLDYEGIKVYTMTVTAQDKNPQSLETSTKVIIKVKDVNDNAPRITVNALSDTENTGHVEISEKEPIDSFVAYIEVEDKDSGMGGEFVCDLDHKDIFEVKQLYPTEYKIVTAALLDRETTPEYDLVFKCTDLSDNPQSSTAHIPVTVLDVNDNSPQFGAKIYTVLMEENNPTGKFMTRVKATDSDAGPNGQIEYRVAGSGVNFITVHPTSGNVTAKVALDYEQAQELEFTIIAFDLGNPPRNDTAVIRVIMTDKDDEVPEFTQAKYTFDVYENMQINTEVGKVTAIDKDSIDFNAFSYYMDPSHSDSENFVVDPQSGIIFTNQVLDREAKSHYSVVIRALSHHDQASQSSVCRVNIHVNDKNDNVPVVIFPTKQNNTVYVSSLASVGDTVAMVTATDADIGINGEIEFTFIDSEGETHFYIDNNSGQITVMANLRAVADQMFHMVVLLKDKGYPQNTVETAVDIVVNMEEEETLSSQNVIIVASVVTISGMLTIALVVAIVITRRQDQKKKKLRYLHKVNNDNHNLVVTDGKGQVGTIDMGHPGVKVDISFSNDITFDEDEDPRMPFPGQITENGKSPQMSPPSYQQYLSSPGKVSTKKYPSYQGPPGNPSSQRSPYPNPQDAMSAHNHSHGSQQHLVPHRPPHPHSQPSLVAGGPNTSTDKDSDSTNSAAMSVTDSGRGSTGEDATDPRPSPVEADPHQNLRDGVLLRPPHLPPAKPPSTTARINNLLHNNVHHHNNKPVVKTATVGRPTMNTVNQNRAQRPSSHSNHRNNNSRKPPPPNPPRPHRGQRNHSDQQNLYIHGNQNSNRGKLNRSWHDDNESGPEWSDEDREYVYYVNASHV